jgi:hypothetical protein
MERRTAVDADRAPPAVEVGGGQDPQYKVAAERGVSADGVTLLVSWSAVIMSRAAAGPSTSIADYYRRFAAAVVTVMG